MQEGHVGGGGLKDEGVEVMMRVDVEGGLFLVRVEGEGAR